MAASKQNLLSRIPAVEILLQEAESQGWTAGIPRRVLVDSVRVAVDQARERLLESAAVRKGDSPHLPERPEGCLAQMGTVPFSDGTELETLRTAVLADARQRALSAVGPHYRKVINATGIILHTALGRAHLPQTSCGKSPPSSRATRCSRPTSPAGSDRNATDGSKTSCNNSPAPRPPRWSTTTPPPPRSS